MTSEYTDLTHEAKTYGGLTDMKNAIFSAGVDQGRSERTNNPLLPALLVLTAYVIGDRFLIPYIKQKIEENKKDKKNENQESSSPNSQ